MFVEGAALSLGIYLLLTVLLSALVVKAVLPEEGSFPAVAASCCLASFAGAMLSVRRSSWGSGQRHGERRRLSAGGGGCGGCCAGSRSPGWAAGACCCCAAQAGDFWRACWVAGGGSGSAVRSAGAARPEKPLVNFTKNTDLSPAAETAATGGRSPAAGETAAANVGRRPLLCLQDIVVFRGGGGDLSRRFYKVNIILFT